MWGSSCVSGRSMASPGRWRWLLLVAARTSSAGAATLSDEEERLLTKRSTEWHRANNWETLFEREKAGKNFK